MQSISKKPSYPPILGGGFHPIREEDIDTLFVKPFPDSAQRRSLAGLLRLLIGKLKQLGIEGELWLDGSFTTRKPDPKDYDVLIVVQPGVIESLSEDDYEAFDRLTGERDVTRMKYGCDIHVCNSLDMGTRQYFRKLFSRNPDEDNPKGIAVIRI